MLTRAGRSLVGWRPESLAAVVALGLVVSAVPAAPLSASVHPSASSGDPEPSPLATCSPTTTTTAVREMTRPPQQ